MLDSDVAHNEEQLAEFKRVPSIVAIPRRIRRRTRLHRNQGLCTRWWRILVHRVWIRSRRRRRLVLKRRGRRGSLLPPAERASGEILDDGVAQELWLVAERIDGVYRLFCQGKPFA